MHVTILNGPNLNLLGTRQPEVYGATTLADIEVACQRKADALGMEIEFHQSNHEGVLVDQIHAARSESDGLIINAGAYTHTSVALMDAVSSVSLPMVEVHLSNVHARESFRHTSFLSPVALGLICGFGAMGYLLALDGLHGHLSSDGDRAP
jgi:3-dehydroquinate dehydratase-2